MVKINMLATILLNSALSAPNENLIEKGGESFCDSRSFLQCNF